MGSFKDGKDNRFSRIPPLGNYGIIPVGRLCILDIDNHVGNTLLTDQVRLFSVLLDIDLSNTYTVATPSGGRHFYFRVGPAFPEDIIFDFPKSSLRRYDAIIQEMTGLGYEVDADLRSKAMRNCYIAGPGSVIEGLPYEVINEAPIVEIPKSGIDNLLNVVDTDKRRKRAKTEAREKAQSELADFGPSRSSSDLSPELPDAQTIKRLQSGLQRSHLRHYHEKRAFVKASIGCCYNSMGLALACVELGIDRDSFRGSHIRRNLLVQDLTNFTIESKTHTSYCPIGSEKLRKAKIKDNGLSLEENLRRRREREISKPKSTFSRPRIVNLKKVAHDLCRGKSTRFANSKEFTNSMIVMENLFLPIMSAGSDSVVVSKSIGSTLGLSESQFSRALRVLREARIIGIYKSSKTGLAPRYRVANTYLSEPLTKLAGYAKLENNGMPVLYSYRSGSFFNEDGVVVYQVEDTSLFEGDELANVSQKYQQTDLIFRRFLS